MNYRQERQTLTISTVFLTRVHSLCTVRLAPCCFELNADISTLTHNENVADVTQIMFAMVDNF